MVRPNGPPVLAHAGAGDCRWWFEDWDDLDFDFEPDPALDSREALTAHGSAVWWSAAASVFDFED